MQNLDNFHHRALTKCNLGTSFCKKGSQVLSRFILCHYSAAVRAATMAAACAKSSLEEA